MRRRNGKGRRNRIKNEDEGEKKRQEKTRKDKKRQEKTRKEKKRKGQK